MARYPEAYLQYLYHFHRTRDFFECHEILEEYWKANPTSLQERTWVGLIQVAVALYHERRGNRKGASKMMKSAVRLLEQADLAALGIDREEWLNRISIRLVELSKEHEVVYKNMNIPLTDPELHAYVTPELSEREISPFLVHKHRLRDRTEVVDARKAALQSKKSRD